MTDTPFLAAVKSGYKEVASLLLEQWGANPDAVDSGKGWTALHFLAAENDDVLVLYCMLTSVGIEMGEENGFMSSMNLNV